MVQALDKGVIGPASIMGWLPDIKAKGQDYALTSTMLWAGIIAGEPLASRGGSPQANVSNDIRQTNSSGAGK
jgi:hypothetical protein